MRSRCIVTFALVMAATPSPAFAAGGKDIASAPAVSYGQLLAGNTATDGGSPGCWGHESWWTLPVIAGDRVTIDFDGVEYETAWPVGTTDYNREHTEWTQKVEVGENGKGEGVFTAPRTGAMPLLLSTHDCNFGGDGAAGPYSFTAYVRHALLLSIPARHTLKPTGTIVLRVLNTDGVAINDPQLSVVLRIRGRGRTRVIGRAHALDGTARVTYRVPKALRGLKVTLSAQAVGTSYLTKTSSSLRVRLLR
jgi:hypothetical protein